MADYAPYGGRGNGVDYMPNARVPYDPQSRVVRGAPLGFNEQHQYNQSRVNQGLAPGSNAASQAALRAPSAPAHMLANDPVMQQGARFAAKVNTPLTPHEYNQGRLIAQQLHGGFKPRGLASQPVGDIGSAPLAQPPAVPGGAASSPLLGRAAPAPGHPGMPIPGVGIGPEAPPADDNSPFKRLGQYSAPDKNDYRMMDKERIAFQRQHPPLAPVPATNPPGTRQSPSGALVSTRPRPGTMMQAPAMGGRGMFGPMFGGATQSPNGGLIAALHPDNLSLVDHLTAGANAALKAGNIQEYQRLLGNAQYARQWGGAGLAERDAEQRNREAIATRNEKLAQYDPLVAHLVGMVPPGQLAGAVKEARSVNSGPLQGLGGGLVPGGGSPINVNNYQAVLGQFPTHESVFKPGADGEMRPIHDTMRQLAALGPVAGPQRDAIAAAAQAAYGPSLQEGLESLPVPPAFMQYLPFGQGLVKSLTLGNIPTVQDFKDREFDRTQASNLGIRVPQSPGPTPSTSIASGLGRWLARQIGG